MTADLVALYRDDDHARVRFVDGRTMTWATGAPPLGIVLPVDPGPPTLADGTLVYEYAGQ